MALLRSKSAPHVPQTSNLSFETVVTASSHRHAARHPKIQRHASALALTSLSTVYRRSARSGHQTPRTEREDDPFSLAGFFPASFSSVGVHERASPVEWDWLHPETDHQERVVGKPLGLTEMLPTPTRSGYASSTSSDEEEDLEWALPATPPLASASSPMFDRGEDEMCGETIRREDKMGVLSLSNLFVLADDSDVVAHRLLSPYSEENLCDSDGLYNAMCALRIAHAVSESASVVGRTTLFSSGEEEDGVVDSDLVTLGTRGLGRLLDMLPL